MIEAPPELNNLAKAHVERLVTSVLKRYTASQIAKWITTETTYAGQPYSFVDHEFQEKVLNDTSRDVVVKKCSQIGLSETAARMALALVNVLRPYTVAYTLPTALFAGTFAKTRIDPVIMGSKTMKENIHKTNDNNEVKQFGDSFLYMRGSATSNAPISIPCDHLIHDELDFSDQEVIGQYTSRLTHSKWKRTTKFSTPTVPKYGVSLAFDESRRHYNMVKCNHCNHYFAPDYHKHVKIPGYDRPLEEITKHILQKIRFREAQLLCPKCYKVPSLQVEHREWVCENPHENFIAAGYQITPFDAPNIIEISYLVEASTKYGRRQDFVNFNLGLEAEDKEATLTREDIERNIERQFEIPTSGTYVMGVDCGNNYHFCIAHVGPWGDLTVVHTESCGMGLARAKYHDLRKRFRVVCTVIDGAPHAETVMALQAEDWNCYAAVYIRSKNMVTHTVVDKETEPEKGSVFVRQVNINRSRSFDGYMDFVRSGHLKIIHSENNEQIITHHISMKRVQTYDNDSGEMHFSWQKTDGNDHYHHTFQYCWTASRIKGVMRPTIALPLHKITKFKQTKI